MKVDDPRSYGRLTADNMKQVFGFEPAYGGQVRMSSISMPTTDMQKPMNAIGYDVFVATSTYRNIPEGKVYRIYPAMMFRSGA